MDEIFILEILDPSDECDQCGDPHWRPLLSYFEGGPDELKGGQFYTDRDYAEMLCGKANEEAEECFKANPNDNADCKFRVAMMVRS